MPNMRGSRPTSTDVILEALRCAEEEPFVCQGPNLLAFVTVSLTGHLVYASLQASLKILHEHSTLDLQDFAEIQWIRSLSEANS